MHLSTFVKLQIRAGRQPSPKYFTVMYKIWQIHLTYKIPGDNCQCVIWPGNIYPGDNCPVFRSIGLFTLSDK